MLEDMWKETRKLDTCNTVDERITACIQEIVVDYESRGALSTSDETQLHLALITYMDRAGVCYDVENFNFTVHTAVQAIVQLEQSTAEQDVFEVHTEYVWETGKKPSAQ